MGPSPVTITQRASSRGRTSEKPSRMAWSSAPRLAGLEMVRRATLEAGSSTSKRPAVESPRESPDGLLLEDNECVALRDRLPLLAEDLFHRARILGLDRHLHLHRFEDHDGVPLVHLLA